VDDRNRLAPVALTVKRPILHLILNSALTDAFFGKIIYHFFDGILFIVHTVKEAGIYHFAVAGICRLIDISALYDFDNVYAEFLGEIIVAVIVSRHSHYCARAVAHHYVVGNINRYFPAVYGVYRGKAVNSDARLILDELSALKLCLFTAFCAVIDYRIHIADFILILVDYRVLRSNYHKCNAEESVGPSCVYPKLFGNIFKREIDERAAALAYPMLLLSLDVGEIVNVLETL